jgi:hypothetical protein
MRKNTILALVFCAAAVLLIAPAAQAQVGQQIGQACGIIINCPAGCTCLSTCDDVHNAGAGNDCVLGYGGNDLIWGGTGNDTLEGGSGNDDLYGESGDDILRGQGGSDDLFGGSEADCLDGGNGTDNLDGGSERDQCANGNITNCEVAVSSC